MAGGAAAAAVGILGALGGLVSKQSHSPVASAPGPRVDTSSAAIASARDRKHAREISRNADKERMMALITDPQVMGLATVIGGLMLSCRMPFHPDPAINARIRGISAASCVLMGLGRAGVGDLTTLGVAGAAGVAVGSSGPGGISGLVPDIPGTDIPVYALTLPGATAWGISELVERIRSVND